MANTTYNRMERAKQPLKKKLSGSGEAPLARDFPELEAVLERNRPKTRLARDNCVYMRNDRDFSQMGLPYKEGYVHCVEVVGNVERRDVTWIGYLQLLHSRNDRIKGVAQAQRGHRHGLSDDQLAQRYFNGAASDTPSWEYVTETAEVRAVEDVLSPVNPKKNSA